VNCLQPEPLFLFCPACGSQHEDLGEWATRPHRTHLCLFCKHEWRPHEHPTVGVALPAVGEELRCIILPHAVFASLDEYSCTMPTGPRVGRFWRRRWPFRAPDRTGIQNLAVVTPGPDGADYNLIVWRRLYVAEWLFVDALVSAARAA
jgi:hypothetical protein